MANDNEFQLRAEQEARMNMSKQVHMMWQIVQKLEEMVSKNYKEIRLVRTDLRNMDKLRPLQAEKLKLDR